MCGEEARHGPPYLIYAVTIALLAITKYRNTRHTKFTAGPRRYDEEFDWNCAVL